MTLRPATNEDREAVERLVFSVLRTYGLEPDPDGTDADLADLEGHYGNRGGCFDVLVDDEDRVIGSVGVYATTSELCELRKMYLAPEARGRGWGLRLLHHALDRARELGFRRMWLETAHSLVEAHRLYRKHGFEPFEAPHRSARCDFALVRDL